MTTIRFSIIVPVYNRPDEVDELLASLVQQTNKSFEVIIVEDGSRISCEHVVASYSDKLPIRYFLKENEGPGPARNFGFAKANGAYFVVFDSDCIIPPKYFEVVEYALSTFKYDAWGGPDRAHENFTLVQKAMGYTMASVFTTGGIRGGKKRVGWFQPRSFNMGLSRRVYETLHGFRFSRFAEDIEFSIRMRNADFNVGLIPEAFVYHKRRTNFIQFFRQVYNFGKGRALIGALYPQEVKLTHWFPTVFVAGLVVLLILPWIDSVLGAVAWALFALYLFMIFSGATIAYRNISVGILSIPSALIQMTGYGVGFLQQRLKILLGEEETFG